MKISLIWLIECLTTIFFQKWFLFIRNRRSQISQGAKSRQQNFCRDVSKFYLNFCACIRCSGEENYVAIGVNGTIIIGSIDFFISLVECCSFENFKILKNLQLLDHEIDNPELLLFGYIAEPSARKSVFPIELISH